MSELSRNDTLLLALIDSGYTPAQEYALSILTSVAPDVVAAGAVQTSTPVQTPAPQVETPVTPPAGGGTVGVEIDATTLDKRGFPWCSQIHAKTKTQDAKGNWKYAVGVDRENLVPQVEADLRAQGYGQPAGAPTPAATPGAATPPPANAGLPPATGAQPGLPPAGVGGLPPIGVTPPKTKVEFPEVGSEEDMDDDALIRTAAALADKHGNDALKKLLVLFGVGEGGTAKDIQAGYKFTFWQYATSDEGLRQQAVI